MFFMSIAEVSIQVCREDYIYNYDWNTRVGYYNLTNKCYPHISWGVGIWCSVIVSLIFIVVIYLIVKLNKLQKVFSATITKL